MREEITMNTDEQGCVSICAEAESLQQIGELQLLLVGGGIGTVTIA
jgi:hypothetical protein